MLPQLKTFYDMQLEPNKSCLLILRDLILNFYNEIREDWKYKMPCFTFKGKMLCYLWVDKKTTQPYILFVDGGEIEHHKLIKGNRAKMKVMYFNANKDIPIDDIYFVLNKSIEIRLRN